MAVDDVSFVNVLGEEISRKILVQQMIDFYGLKLDVGETRVTDFNEGSEIRNLLESVAVDHYTILEDLNEVTKIAFVETADGEWLDKHGANPFVQLARETGNEAQGSVTFSLPEALSDDVVISEGTIVVSDDGLDFSLDADCLISAGDTTADMTVTCLTVGVDGNVPSGSVNTIDDDFINTDNLTVTNSDAFSGGIDYEDDDDYRERLLAFVRKDDFGSTGYYVNLAESISGVHDVLLVDATGYTKKVIVNGDVKDTPASVLSDVTEAFTDLDNIVVGHSFTVAKPTYTTCNLAMSLNVSVELDEDDLEEMIQCIFDGGECMDELEFDGLFINEELTKDRFYEAIKLVEYIESVTITSGGTEITTLTPATNGVLKLGTLSITQTVVS